MASQLNHLHFLLIPLMSQSHIIPLTDFAKLLALRGVIVSIITTPSNFTRYEATIKHATEDGLRIRMIPLEFPGQESGLPPGCENMDSLTSMNLAMQFFQACEMLKSPLEKLIQNLDPKPSCIISTNSIPWTQQVAETFKIPRYVFETISCFTLLCSHILSHHDMRETETFVVPDIPHMIEFTKAQLPGSMNKSSHNNNNNNNNNNNIGRIIDQINEAKLSARGTLVNSFEELEHGYVEGYAKERQRLWCIGPVSLCNKKIDEKLDRGNKAEIDDKCCMSWLDSMKRGSVIYACFGSLCSVSGAQIKEIGLGLEASNSPFIWVIRKLDCSKEVEKWLNEEKFEERVEGKGLIIRGWAPQILILSHPSVGGFLMHCGWNSTLEGVCAGVPMITWPMFAEQFYNEKFIVQVLKIGVKIRAKLKVDKDEKKELVTWDLVKELIEKLMDEDEEGKERRIRARRLGEMAKEALEQGGSSYMNISLLIQDVIEQANNG